MKDRLIDTSLLVVLILVALAIFWTLLSSFGISLNLLPNRTPPASQEVQTEPENPTDDSSVISIAPEETTPALEDETTSPGNLEQHATNVNGDVLIIDPSETANTANETSNDELSSSSDAADNATPEDIIVEDSPSIIAVPESAIELERIGFSSVTGGVGACNVILEPWKHIAVSRDIRETYPCGSELTVRLETPIDGRSSFTGIVADTMNPSKVKTVNVYVETQELAFEYGVTDGLLEP